MVGFWLVVVLAGPEFQRAGTRELALVARQRAHGDDRRARVRGVRDLVGRRVRAADPGTLLTVVVADTSGNHRIYSLADLLPYAFGPRDLSQA